MKIKIHYNKSMHENAGIYYELAKESKEKLKGIDDAIKKTEREIIQAKKLDLKKKQQVKIKRQKEWYEKFHWAVTETGRLMIGGRSAQQNDQLVAKNFETNDLFFHADIQGGSVVILKDGINAAEDELTQAAQLAASFSNAWKNANAGVDVYAVRLEQVAKAATGGFIPTGAFAITGERKWFRSTKVALKVGLLKGRPVVLPRISNVHLDSVLELCPSRSGKEKGELAKTLSKKLNVHVDELLEILPNGKAKIMENGK